MVNRFIHRLEQYIESRLDQREIPALFNFGFLIYLLSVCYGWGISIRYFFYKTGVFKSSTLPCPVVSVGNMIAGGAGKTPMAIYLADLCLRLGKQPAVVSRGYTGDFKAPAIIVGDGQSVFTGVERCGDEPLMMARKKRFPMVVGKKRVNAARTAIEQLNSNAIILDDGFQHLSLNRNLNLLLVDYKNPVGNGRLLPSGRLRETPEKAFSRADAVIFTRCPKGGTPRIPDGIHFNCPSFFTRHQPNIHQVISRNGIADKENNTLDNLKGRSAVLFSGLAHNRSFFDTVSDLGVKIVSHLEFKDHYRYKKADIEQVCRQALEATVDMVLTTEKDWVKLEQYIDWPVPLVVMGITIEFEDQERFDRFIKEQIG